jgi:NAD(P)H-hydrate epimerase
MTEIDRAAIEAEKIPGLTLMEAAGSRVAEASSLMLSGGGRRAAIWCGKGNNGGDGLVAARLLAGSGCDVEVFVLASPGELSGDAKANYDRLSGLPVVVTRVERDADVERFTAAVPRFDLVIDAIFGTGFSGVPVGTHEAAIAALNEYGAPVLAVDIPSGVSGETGAAPGTAVRATRTVTFAAAKVGLVQYPGTELAGELEVADIGIPVHLLETIPSSRIYLTEQADAEALLPRRAPDTHKRRCGSVLVVGGSPGMTGAPAMCAQAALRAGAGMVTAAVPDGLHDIFEIKLTEVMTRPLPQEPRGGLSVEAAPVITGVLDMYDVIALGPGMGTATQTVQLVRELVSEVDLPLVLDADGLNAMAGATEIFSRRSGPLVLTPHPGEMARLTGKTSSQVQDDRVAAALEFAREWGAVVVLKGARTVVAEPGGEVMINPTGNPGMATAGMGDVLTGCIASFVGQGLKAFEAAVAGAYFHGLAADLAAQMDAMVGMTAGDVIRHLPLALRVE